MSKVKFTSGEWKVGEEFQVYSELIPKSIGNADEIIVEVPIAVINYSLPWDLSNNIDVDENSRIAQLISSSPDLLSVCLSILNEIKDVDKEDSDSLMLESTTEEVETVGYKIPFRFALIEQLEKAVTKAKGEL